MRTALIASSLIAGSLMPLAASAQNRVVRESYTWEELSHCAQCVLKARANAKAFLQTSMLVAEPSTVSSSFGFVLGPAQSAFSLLENTMNSDLLRDRKPYVLNADIQPVFALGGPRWVIGSARWEKPIYSTIHFIPRFKVRILANDPERGDGSHPVRTPSYMPGAEYFISAGRFWDPKVSGTRHYLAFKAWHHSNGQDTDGGEFDSKGWFNTRNGDYNETLVLQAAYGGIARLRRPEPPKMDNDTAYRVHARKFGNARTPRESGPIAWKAGLSHSPWMTDSVNPYFGNTRITLSFTQIWAPWRRDIVRHEGEVFVTAEPWTLKEQFRLDWRMEFIADEPHKYRSGPYGKGKPYTYARLDKRLNLYGTLYYVFPRMSGAGVFAQAGYYGSDPYNAYFQESQWFWRIGLALGSFLRTDPFADAKP